MRRRTVLGLSAALIGGGAAHRSGAFDTIGAIRGVGIDAASDPNGLLGLEAYADPSVVPKFTNQSNSQMQITLDATVPANPDNIEFDLDVNDTYQTVPVSFNIDPGNTRLAQVNGGSPEVNVSITGTLNDGQGSRTAIEMDRTFAVPQAEQIQITPNVKSDGSSGKYEFGLTNTGSIEVDLVGIGVNWTSNPNAVKVGGKQNDRILYWVEQRQEVLNDVMQIDSSDDTTAQTYNFITTQNFPGYLTLVPESNGGQEQTLEFDRFRKQDDKGADMKGQDVIATLVFSDDSTTVQLAVDQ